MASSCDAHSVEGAVNATNSLAINLHKLFTEGNVFFSPLSISTVLAMLLYGAKDETAREIKKAMELVNDEDVSCFGQLLSSLGTDPELYTLDSANSLVIQKDFHVKDEYKSLVKESFKALLVEVDFLKETGRAILQINEWVKEKTRNMIPQLLDDLDPSTVLVLLNAIYFKGSWLHKFEKQSTYQQNFYNNGSKYNIKKIEMMHMKEDFRFVEKPTFKALEMPYNGEEMAMLILLPSSLDGLHDLEQSLAPTFLKDLKREMWEKEVKVAFPKFRLEYSKSLKEPFRSLGMNKIFQQGAQLDGISDSRDLAVSDVVHKAVLVVNEEGSEAAAATAVKVMLCSLVLNEPEFIADHPFLFVIYNTKNDLIIFMGRVNEL